ncbi:hypothetical protein GGE16_005951 [Rhizobium leguminosarum]|uniref:Uncharacterized protein n=1 Tax=Rhizobium leguminosarum TaxID=384 RepID=A0AAE2MR03_RHILE|nr:hypothetical protein RHEC894_PB00225 [Rhizobium sp. CIAT894]MBB4293857.1 hypothetical protein [Rhizobium leguminosarum]MBB4435145.1 hypothetical protein [Rhizobium esperanzae]MBB4299590.1 hypothetical protein [Rhizobium leguminosarum]MBB4311027.1 hypothetical protein [Rhizobium leguminosarum]
MALLLSLQEKDIILDVLGRAGHPITNTRASRNPKSVGDERQAFAGEVVNDSQDQKATTIRESVADDVEATAGRDGQRSSRSKGTLATAPFARGQLFFPVEMPGASSGS